MNFYSKEKTQARVISFGRGMQAALFIGAGVLLKGGNIIGLAAVSSLLIVVTLFLSLRELEVREEYKKEMNALSEALAYYTTPIDNNIHPIIYAFKNANGTQDSTMEVGE